MKEHPDFLVGGIARSGTTLFGQSFLGQEDVYCFFRETSFYRYLRLLAGNSGVPPEKLGKVRELVSRVFKSQFSRNSDTDFIKRHRRFPKFASLLGKYEITDDPFSAYRLFESEREVERFVDEYVRLFENGDYGARLFRKGNALLSRVLRERSGASIVGEKTPAHLLELETVIASCPEIRAYAVIREPFSVIRSMQRRAQRGRPSDRAFSSDYFSCLGQYCFCLEKAISLASRLPKDHYRIVRYEDLIRSPREIMRSIFGDLGLTNSDRALDFAADLVVEPRHVTDPHDLGFSEHQVALTWLVLGSLLELAGYDRRFYQNKGVKVGESCLRGAVEREAIIPLYGFWSRNARELTGAWMGETAQLYLVANRTKRHVAIQMRCDFPDVAGRHDLSLSVSANGTTVYEHKVDTMPGRFEMDLDLTTMPPQIINKEFQGVLLKLEASSSFRPFCVLGMGDDLRALSFKVISLELH